MKGVIFNINGHVQYVSKNQLDQIVWNWGLVT